jgi:DNA-binding MarR family transcriptional regulator
MSSFLTLFSQVSRESKEAFQRKLRPYGLHAGQHFLLELLWDAQEGLTIGEIAARLGVEDPSVTRTVQRMARQGLVEKYPHPTDARQVIVKLTKKGWDLQRIIPQLLAESEEQLLAHISDVERAFLIRLLAQMLHNLEQEHS